MEKLTNALGYLPELAFFALMVRIVTVGAGIGDAIAIISIVASMGYKLYISKAKVSEKEAMDKKMEEIAAQVQSLSMDRALRRQVNEQKTQATSAPRKLF